jgi:hypothetical protein
VVIVLSRKRLSDDAEDGNLVVYIAHEQVSSGVPPKLASGAYLEGYSASPYPSLGSQRLGFLHFVT